MRSRSMSERRRRENGRDRCVSSSFNKRIWTDGWIETERSPYDGMRMEAT